MAAAPPGSNAIRSAKDLFSALLSVAPVPSYNDDVKAKAASLLQDLVVLSNQTYERPRPICNLISACIARLPHLLEPNDALNTSAMLFIASAASTTASSMKSDDLNEAISVLILLIGKTKDMASLARALVTDCCNLVLDSIEAEAVLADAKVEESKQLTVVAFKETAVVLAASSQQAKPLESRRLPLGLKESIASSRKFFIFLVAQLLNSSIKNALNSDDYESAVSTLWSIISNTSAKPWPTVSGSTPEKSSPSLTSSSIDTSVHTVLSAIKADVFSGLDSHAGAALLIRFLLESRSIGGRIPRQFVSTALSNVLQLFPRKSELSFECLKEVSKLTLLALGNLTSDELALYGLRLIELLSSMPRITSQKTSFSAASRLSKFEGPQAIVSNPSLSGSFESGVVFLKRTILRAVAVLARTHPDLFKHFDFLLLHIGEFPLQDELSDCFTEASRASFTIPVAEPSNSNSQSTSYSRKRKLGEDSPVKLDPPKFTVDAMDIDEDAASPNATPVNSPVSDGTFGFISKLFAMQNQLKFEAENEAQFLKSCAILDLLYSVASRVKGALGVMPMASLAGTVHQHLGKIIAVFKGLSIPSPAMMMAFTLAQNVCRHVLIGSGLQRVDVPTLEKIFELATFPFLNKTSSFEMSDKNPFFDAIVVLSFSVLAFFPPSYLQSRRLEIFKEFLQHENPLVVMAVLKAVPIFVLRYGNECLPALLPILSTLKSSSNAEVLKVLLEMTSFLPGLSQMKPIVIAPSSETTPALKLGGVEVGYFKLPAPAAKTDLVPFKIFFLPSSFFTVFCPQIPAEDSCPLDSALSQEFESYTEKMLIPKSEFPSSLPRQLKYDDMAPFLALHSNAEGVRSTLCNFIARVFYYCKVDVKLDEFYGIARALLHDPAKSVRVSATYIFPSYAVKLDAKRSEDFLHVRRDLRDLFSKYTLKPEIMHTLLLAYGQVAPFMEHSKLMIIMLFLTDRLTDSDSSVRGVAFEQIHQIAEALKLKPSELIERFKETIYPIMAQNLVQQYEMIDAVCSALLDCSADKFLRSTLRTTLPILFFKFAANPKSYPENFLEKIADRLVLIFLLDDLMMTTFLLNSVISQGLDLNKMLLENIDVIIGYSMARSPTEVVRLLSALLPTVGFAQLLVSCLSSLSLELVKMMGHPDVAMREKGKKGLTSVAKLIHPDDKSEDVAANLLEKEHFLSICHHLKARLIRKEATMEEKKVSLNALEALVELMEPHLSKFHLKIIGMLKTVKDVPQLMPLSLGVWDQLLRRLGNEYVGRLIGDIVVELLPYLEIDACQSRAIQLFTYLFKDKKQYLKAYYGRVAFLPDHIPALDSLFKAIPELNYTNFGDVLKQLVSVLEKEGSGVRLLAVKRLLRMMRDPAHHKTFLTMLRISLKGTNDGDAAVRRVFAELIGELGAIDPQRVDVTPEQLDCRELTDAELAFALLSDHLTPLYKNAPSDASQDRVAYVIQEVLRACQCDSSTPNLDAYAPPAGKPELAWKIWKNLRDDIKEIIEPFLTSQYSNHAMRVTYPKLIFNEMISYDTWLKGWTCKMIEQSKSDILRSLSVVIEDDLNIAHFIIPHVVVMILGSDNEEAKDQLKVEVVSVLNASDVDHHRKILETPSKSVVAKSSFQMITQRILMLIDYLYVFLENVEAVNKAAAAPDPNPRGGRQKERGVSEAVGAIKGLLNSIPQLTLSRASYRCQAYARTLLHYEEHIRQKVRETTVNHSFDYINSSLQLEYYKSIIPDVAYLQKVYAGLNEPDAIYGLIDASDTLTVEEQTAQSEAMGDWSRALNGYCEAIVEREASSPPGSPFPQNIVALHHGRLKCLFHLGRFQDAIDVARGLLSDSRLQFAHRSIRSYALQSAWRLGDWNSVSWLIGDETKPEARCESTFDSSVAAILLAIRHGKFTDVPNLLKSARDLVLAPLTAASMDSYNRAYFSIAELHVLSELEKAALLAASSNKEAAAAATLQQWADRFDLTQPSFTCREPIVYARAQICELLQWRTETPLRWLEISKMSRVANLLPRSSMALSKVNMLGLKDERYIIEHAKLLWASGNQRQAMQALWHQIAGMKLIEAPTAVTPTLPLNQNSGLGLSQLSMVAATRLKKELQGSAPRKGIASVSRPSKTADGEEEPLNRNQKELLLCAIKWIKETGLEQVREVEKLFGNASQSGQGKAFYRYARHIDDTMKLLKMEKRQDESSAHSSILPNCILNYALSCIHGNHYVYQSLPRLITLVLDYFDDVVKGGLSGSSQLLVDSVLEVTIRVFRKIPASLFMTCFTQIASRVLHRRADIQELLESVIVRCFEEFPYQAIWQFIGFMKYAQQNRRTLYATIKSKVAEHSGKNSKVVKIFEEAEKLITPLEVIAKFGVDTEDKVKEKDTLDTLIEHHNSKKNNFVNFTTGHSSYDLILPTYQFLTISVPQSSSDRSTTTADSALQRPSAPTPVTFSKIEPKFHCYNSKQKPKRLTVVGSDGKEYQLIAKYGDDIRKDSRVMDLGVVVNLIFKKNPESAQRQLKIRTYACTPLGENMGLLEVVPNVKPLRDVLFALYKENGHEITKMRAKANDLYKAREKVRDEPDWLSLAEFLELRNHFVPILYRWFLENFPDPNLWFRAKLQYAHSVAVMSMFGYIVGLGDRHGENLLCDARTGEIVHVDFGCLFFTGQLLKVPETVPFRLTHNMVDAMGITGSEGTFRRSCEVALELLRHHKDLLKATLEAYIHDPLIDWNRTNPGHKQQQIENKNTDRDPGTAFQGIEDRLNGKLRDLFNTVGSKANKRTTTAPLLPLSVPAQVEALLEQATSPEQLRRLWKGWASYL